MRASFFFLPRPASGDKTWLFLFAVLVSLLLLALSAPAARARLQLLWGDSTRTALAEGRPVSTNDLALLLASRARVAAGGYGFHSSVIYNELAMARLQAAQNKDVQPDLIKQLLREAIIEQKMALTLSPADTYGWARFAFLLALDGAPSENTIRALNMEMMTAPYEPALMLPRLGLALSLYGKMDSNMRDLADNQLRVTWKRRPKEVEALAKAARQSSVLERALRADPQTASWLGGRSLGQP